VHCFKKALGSYRFWTAEMTDAPVAVIPTDPPVPKLDPTPALSLSGGGYRAMLFHAGVFWRLYEADLLGDIARIVSVSGGSIATSLLGLKWSRLSFQLSSLRTDFVPEVIAPLRALARETIDVWSVVMGFLFPWRTSVHVARAHDRKLFNGATLQDLPDTPRFVINATNIQSGVLWRFMKPYMRDWRVGKVCRPTVRLADAVAASSAFPPVLSPFELHLKESDFEAASGDDLQQPPFTTNVILADGGIYDSLELETAWKRHQTILVSDGGANCAPEKKPWSNWGSQAYRVLNLIDSRVRALRTRQIVDSLQAKVRLGAYWGVRTDIRNYGLTDALNCPLDSTQALARIPTRLKRLDDATRERLVNWGYAVCDAALRAHVYAGLPKPAFPYPQRGA
jgi:NTE family protein